MDTSIPSSADLAGDQAVISRAQALQPAVAAASNEIEDGRRIAPALLDRLHEAEALPPAAATIRERDRDRSRHLLPRDRDDRQRRRLDRLVPEPGRRLRHDGGLSCAAGGQRDLRPTIRAPCWPGDRDPRRAPSTRRGRLQGDRRLGLRLGLPARHLAGRSLPRYSDADGHAPARRRRPAGRAHPAGAGQRGRLDRHLERGRPARHGVRPVRPHRSFRAGRPYVQPRLRPSGERAAASPARSTACRR